MGINLAMWDNVLNLAAQYGPFPIGNIVGIYITNIAFSKVAELTKQKEAAQSESIRHLTELIESQQARIDKLHDELHRNQSGGVE